MEPNKSQKSTEPESRILHALTHSFEELLRIIRDYGMPTVAFGAGIYGFLMLLNVEVGNNAKIALAALLSIGGMLSQMWSFSRDNPRVHSDEYTRLVETMIGQNEKHMEYMSEVRKDLMRIIEHNRTVNKN